MERSYGSKQVTVFELKKIDCAIVSNKWKFACSRPVCCKFLVNVSLRMLADERNFFFLVPSFLCHMLGRVLPSKAGARSIFPRCGALGISAKHSRSQLEIPTLEAGNLMPWRFEEFLRKLSGRRCFPDVGTADLPAVRCRHLTSCFAEAASEKWAYFVEKLVLDRSVSC